MRALDAALRRIALAFGLREVFAAGRRDASSMSRAFSSLRGQLDAQLLEALFALEHARMRIAAAVDAQPVAADPLARAGDDRFIVARSRGAACSASASVSARRTRDSSRTMAAGPDDHAGQHAGGAVGFHVLAGLQQRDSAHRTASAAHPASCVELVDTQRFEVVAERGFDRALPAAAHRSCAASRGCCASPEPASHSAVRESPRPSAAFCRASSDTTSARQRLALAARAAPGGSRLRTAPRAASASGRAPPSAPATIRRRSCAPRIPFR